MFYIALSEWFIDGSFRIVLVRESVIVRGVILHRSWSAKELSRSGCALGRHRPPIFDNCIARVRVSWLAPPRLLSVWASSAISRGALLHGARRVLYDAAVSVWACAPSADGALSAWDCDANTEASGERRSPATLKLMLLTPKTATMTVLCVLTDGDGECC